MSGTDWLLVATVFVFRGFGRARAVRDASLKVSRIRALAPAEGNRSAPRPSRCRRSGANADPVPLILLVFQFTAATGCSSSSSAR
jgi:hypothetical protein